MDELECFDCGRPMRVVVDDDARCVIATCDDCGVEIVGMAIPIEIPQRWWARRRWRARIRAFLKAYVVDDDPMDDERLRWQHRTDCEDE